MASFKVGDFVCASPQMGLNPYDGVGCLGAHGSGIIGQVLKKCRYDSESDSDVDGEYSEYDLINVRANGRTSFYGARKLLRCQAGSEGEAPVEGMTELSSKNKDVY